MISDLAGEVEQAGILPERAAAPAAGSPAQALAEIPRRYSVTPASTVLAADYFAPVAMGGPSAER